LSRKKGDIPEIFAQKRDPALKIGGFGLKLFSG